MWTHFWLMNSVHVIAPKGHPVKRGHGVSTAIKLKPICLCCFVWGQTRMIAPVQTVPVMHLRTFFRRTRRWLLCELKIKFVCEHNLRLKLCWKFHPPVFVHLRWASFGLVMSGSSCVGEFDERKHCQLCGCVTVVHWADCRMRWFSREKRCDFCQAASCWDTTGWKASEESYVKRREKWTWIIYGTLSLFPE